MKNSKDWTSIILAIALLVAVAGCATYKTYISKAIESEARMNLGQIFTTQVAYFGETNTYANSFKLLNWAPEQDPPTRYSYFVADDVIQAGVGGPYSLPTGHKSMVNAESFTIYAVGNIDKDATLDVWSINDCKVVEHVIDDEKK